MTAAVPVPCANCKGTGIDPRFTLMTRCRVCEPYIPDRRRRQMSATTETERKVKSVRKNLSIKAADRFQNRNGVIYIVMDVDADQNENPLDDLIHFETEGKTGSAMTLCRDDVHQLLEYSWERLPNGLVTVPRQKLIFLNNLLVAATQVCNMHSCAAVEQIAEVRREIDTLLYPND